MGTAGIISIVGASLLIVAFVVFGIRIIPNTRIGIV
jgi:hypothetical protein